MNTETISCKACGNSFEGKFCNNCGEKVYNESDKSLKALFDDVFHFFTHFDNKFFKTVKLVITKPGYLSVKYCEGVRKPYFKPTSLFFICVILYLLFPLFAGLNMRFQTYVSNNYMYAEVAAPVVKKKLETSKITTDQLAEKYNNTSPKFAKVLILLFLPLSALVLQILFFKQRRYYFDHFILATELNTFYVLIGFLLLPIFVISIMALWPATASSFQDGSTFFKVILAAYHLVFAVALKRFYKEGWVWTIIKTLLFILAFMFVVRFIYNIILFYLVMFFI